MKITRFINSLFSDSDKDISEEKSYRDICNEQSKIIQQKKIINDIKDMEEKIKDAVSKGFFYAKKDICRIDEEFSEIKKYFVKKGFKVFYKMDFPYYIIVSWS